MWYIGPVIKDYDVLTETQKQHVLKNMNLDLVLIILEIKGDASCSFK